MKRSEINKAIKFAEERLKEYRITLPEFGYWHTEDWKKNKDSISLIKERMLGWDVTDFGSDDFDKCGAVLFTVRNGDKNDMEYKAPYAEKYILMSGRNNQEIPFHYHTTKTEDIINRGGGVLVVEMYQKANGGGIDKNKKVEVYTDCIKKTYAPGEPIYIYPGNSITIEPEKYHRFYAKENDGMLIVGEVSKVNDDNCDNTFLKPSKRFIPIEEDEPIYRLLVNEYDKI